MNGIFTSLKLGKSARKAVANTGAAVAVMGLLSALPSLAADARTLQFTRDIVPLLAENCLACHGPDPETRKAGLRLDTKDGLFKATDKHEAPVIPGSPEKSELYKRIMASDPDDIMPPPKSHKVLKPEQKEMFKQWILAGAPWQGHWSFIRPDRGTVPAVKNSAWVRNPIDAFILAKLDSQGITPAPEADRRTLARRVAYDVTGLPPAKDEVEKFVKDRAPDAYEKYLNRMLHSPSWGEHRARYWLDAARYSDTHGLHFDNYREMWTYRDYVIRSFNANKPFDKFVIEQLAGDLLPNPTDDELVATGFHRCNMTTNEGGTIEEENLTNYANDRVATTGWVFLGLTANCAACHDHKFDPITQKEFYSLAAYFRNTTQSGFDRNRREGDLFMVVPQTDKEKMRWKALPTEMTEARKLRTDVEKVAAPGFTNWLSSAVSDKLVKNVAFNRDYLKLPLAEEKGTHVRGELNGKAQRFEAPEKQTFRADGPYGPAPILKAEQNYMLGDLGDFDSQEPLTFSAWVWVPKDFKGEGSIASRMADETLRNRGWDFFLRDDEVGISLVNRLPSITLRVRTKDKAIAREGWHHVAATYDGSMRVAGVKLYVDGTDAPVQVEQDRLEGTMHVDLPLRIGRREKGSVLNGVALQEVRIVRRQLASTEVAAMTAAPRVTELLAQAKASPTNAVAVKLLRDYFLVTQEASWQKASANFATLDLEYAGIRGRSPVAHIQKEKTNSEPTAFVLFRGEYDKPRDKVGAGTPASLNPMPKGAPNNRLGLAQWLVAPENPLMARATVNRFWQEVFGTGLVKTSEDFGNTGEPPVNQALLDWLAVEFQESGWNVEHIFRLMLTSAAYRQSAVTTAAKLEKDPANRLLSRGPRFRMDAEMIRDTALTASGLLAPRIGGPSVRPYQPPGVWEVVGMPESNTRFYSQDHGADLYRRSLYTFWKRASPPASMDILNAPSRETCAVRRERTNTPLQALVSMNDTQFMEAARKLAEGAWARARGRKETAVNEMAERVLSRPLSAEEMAIVQQTLASLEHAYNEEPEAAAQLLKVGESPVEAKAPDAKLAALTMVANQLLNLDEALNK